MKNNPMSKVRTAIVVVLCVISLIFAAIGYVVSCAGCGAVCIIAMHNEAGN